VPDRREEQLLHLVDRAERGVALADEYTLLRQLILITCQARRSQAGEITFLRGRLHEATGSTPASDPLSRALADKLAQQGVRRAG
jgi:hypothetical protein